MSGNDATTAATSTVFTDGWTKPFSIPAQDDGLIELHAALARAVAAARAVPLEGRHAMGYRYAAAEDVIVEARRVLSDQGLCVVPMGSEVEKGELMSHFRLIHDQGGTMSLGAYSAPVMPRKGGTDKATFAARTSLLAYLLRDLLLLPRMDGGIDAMAPTREEAGGGNEGAAPAVPLLSAKGQAAVKRLNKLKDMAGLETAETWFMEQQNARMAGEPVDLSAEDFNAIEKALRDNRGRLQAGGAK